jgi:hypothetical protein
MSSFETLENYSPMFGELSGFQTVVKKIFYFFFKYVSG